MNPIILNELKLFAQELQLGDLQAIHDKETFYISRLKLNTRIYIKNAEAEFFNNGTLKASCWKYFSNTAKPKRFASVLFPLDM
ncbi:hypothetical protein IC621_04440 [Bacillus sp. IB182487]|uniref:Uncharacterized protein n=1 Tax=Metabacillus arenae TaxID=2771434 RepID=A0A926NEQ4_9BACI|nr:hypothetical protein [Metabacillus arenae]MBD1379470.1 hypothetical protein [Metabacillus arenae]